MSVATMKLGEGLSVLQKLDLSLQEMLCMPTKALNQLAGEAQLTTAELAELKAERRRAKNREAAQTLRRKKKQHVDDMLDIIEQDNSSVVQLRMQERAEADFNKEVQDATMRSLSLNASLYNQCRELSEMLSAGRYTQPAPAPTPTPTPAATMPQTP